MHALAGVDHREVGEESGRRLGAVEEASELAEGAGLTLHVRLIEGAEPEHVLEAIFKALGVALAQSCRQRRTEA